jgi:hypothetical protein
VSNGGVVVENPFLTNLGRFLLTGLQVETGVAKKLILTQQQWSKQHPNRPALYLSCC